MKCKTFGCKTIASRNVRSVPLCRAHSRELSAHKNNQQQQAERLHNMTGVDTRQK